MSTIDLIEFEFRSAPAALFTPPAEQTTTAPAA
jgi:hypothetical protein